MKLSEIIVPDRRRAADPSKCRALMESIREVGLLNPITVLPDNTLVAGLHRKLACELLGWTEIPAIVVDLDALKAELAEIDENLCRHERTALERAEDTARRKEVYEALHPETRPVRERGGPGRAGKETNDNLSLVSFAEDTAQKTGQSRRTVERAAAIGEKLVPELKDAIRETDLADNQSALSALAAKTEEVQRKLVAEGPLAVKEAARAKRQPEIRNPKSLPRAERAELLEQAEREDFERRARSFIEQARRAAEWEDPRQAQVLLRLALVGIDAAPKDARRCAAEFEDLLVKYRAG